jgi:hypothetical protein
MPRHQIIAAHVVTATIKFTGILLVMMRPGPLQWTRTQSPFLLSPTAAGLSSKPGTWAPQGAPFYLWLSINCGMELMTLFAGPIALYPPRGRGQWESRAVCAVSFISANGSASHRISMIDALARSIPIGNRCQDSGASNRQPPRTHFFAVVGVRD